MNLKSKQANWKFLMEQAFENWKKVRQDLIGKEIRVDLDGKSYNIDEFIEYCNERYEDDDWKTCVKNVMPFLEHFNNALKNTFDSLSTFGSNIEKFYSDVMETTKEIVEVVDQNELYLKKYSEPPLELTERLHKELDEKNETLTKLQFQLEYFEKLKSTIGILFGEQPKELGEKTPEGESNTEGDQTKVKECYEEVKQKLFEGWKDDDEKEKDHPNYKRQVNGFFTGAGTWKDKYDKNTLEISQKQLLDNEDKIKHEYENHSSTT